MNEILFMIGDQPVRAGVALIGISALVLTLLTIIAIVLARSGRRGAELAVAQAIRADELEERLSEMRWGRPWRAARPRWRGRSASGWIR